MFPFSMLVSFTDKTGFYYITEMLMKKVLNTITGRVKPKTVQFVLVAFPLRTQHLRVGAKLIGSESR